MTKNCFACDAEGHNSSTKHQSGPGSGMKNQGQGKMVQVKARETQNLGN